MVERCFYFDAGSPGEKPCCEFNNSAHAKHRGTMFTLVSSQEMSKPSCPKTPKLLEMFSTLHLPVLNKCVLFVLANGQSVVPLSLTVTLPENASKYSDVAMSVRRTSHELLMAATFAAGFVFVKLCATCV